jgi:hypothetical protein
MGLGPKSVWVRKTDQNKCSVSDTFLLAFYDSPSVYLGRDTDLCQGQNIKLVAGPASNNSYTWRILPGQNTVSMINSVNIDSSGMYEVIMTNQYGCQDRDTIDIKVHENPKKPQLTASDTHICLGDTAFVRGPASFARYKWNSGDTTAVVITLTSRSFDLIVYDSFGCESPVSDSLSVVVHSLPAAPELRVTPDTALCPGETCLLFISGSAFKYHWQDSVGASYRYADSSGSFYLRLEDQFGCVSQMSNIVQVALFASPPKPEIEIMSGNTDLCPGDSLLIRSKTPALQYEWNHLNTDRQISIFNTGFFAIRHISVEGCKSEFSDTLYSVLHARPNKPVILNTLGDSLYANLPANKYRWYENGILSQDTNNYVKGTNSHYYHLRIGNSWCWSDLSDSFYFDRSGLMKMSAATRVEFPA